MTNSLGNNSIGIVLLKNVTIYENKANLITKLKEIDCFQNTTLNDVIIRTTLGKILNQNISINLDVNINSLNYNVTNIITKNITKYDLKTNYFNEINSFRFRSTSENYDLNFNYFESIIDNPCYLNGFKNDKMIGKGNYLKCYLILKKLINNCKDDSCYKASLNQYGEKLTEGKNVNK